MVYEYQPYPAVRYHRDGRQVVVKSPEEQEANAPDEGGWGDNPAFENAPQYATDGKAEPNAIEAITAEYNKLFKKKY